MQERRRNILIGLFVLGGAAIVARLLWGSGRLLRPFGYWGGVAGAVAGMGVAHVTLGIPLSRVAVALVICGTFAQAVGRLRCLAQGCCHGVVTENPEIAIRVWQPQSRVVQISKLAGRYVVSSPTYSIVFNAALGVLLWAAWEGGRMSDWLIGSLYLLLTGLERFSEDAYRGEVQTRFGWGLRENQWIALGAWALGLFVALLPATGFPQRPGAFDAAWPAAVLAGGLMTAVVMSMDFPKSNGPFARLTG
jgi:prolipoprotein diacylglyceryltransferase